MYKYEITILTDTKTEEKFIKDFLTSVFPKSKSKISKLERTDLAYEINKSKKGHYFVAELSTEPETISEFRRRARLEKRIWRFLEINLDHEKGLNRPLKEKPEYLQPGYRRNRYNNRNRRPNNSNERYSSDKNTATDRKTTPKTSSNYKKAS